MGRRPVQSLHGYPKTWTHSVRHCYAETRRLADEEEIFECLEIELEESMMLHVSSTSLTALPRLIGRESQMGALVAYRHMRQGHTVVCSVHGRSGMGKSALMKYSPRASTGKAGCTHIDRTVLREGIGTIKLLIAFSTT